MSEFMNARTERNIFYRRLLASASAFALLTSAGLSNAFASDDSERPTMWIELGGQLEGLTTTQDPFAPAFLTRTPRPSFETVHPLDAEKPPQYSVGGEGKFIFEPEDSNWVFSAAIRYGRSNGNKIVHQQTSHPPLSFSSSFQVTPYDDNYANTNVAHRQSHAVVDFQAGKDFGLGMFGKGGSSVLSLGVRYAQFSSSTTANIRERPDVHAKGVIKYFHSYGLMGHAAREFRGVGPSLDWNTSAPFAGNPETEFTFDWGLNAAILFGRQKAIVSHHTSGRYVKVKYGTVVPAPYETGNARNDARAVTIPNLGGFAGVSVKFPNAKVSLGYRADFFFGAVDGGIDARKRENAGFYGPFASISIGLGG